MTFTAGEIRNPKRNIPLSLVIGTGVVLLLYVLCNFVYLSVLPLAGDSGGDDDCGAGDSVCIGGQGCYGGDGAGFRWIGREADGRGDSDFDVRVRERAAAGWGAGLLRDEPGRAVLQVGWAAE